MGPSISQLSIARSHDPRQRDRQEGSLLESPDRFQRQHFRIALVGAEKISRYPRFHEVGTPCWLHRHGPWYNGNGYRLRLKFKHRLPCGVSSVLLQLIDLK